MEDVTVTVTEVTGAPATPALPNGPLTYAVDADLAGGSAIGAPVTAAGDAVRYSLDSGSDATFGIDCATGQLSLDAAASLNRASFPYSLTVTATDRQDDTDTVTVNVTLPDVDVPAVMPGTPDAPTVTSSSTDRLRVAWSASTSGGAPTDYNVQFRQGTTGAWTSHDHTGAWTSTTIAGLTANTTYQVQVQAANSAGNSGWSASGAGTTAETPDMNDPPSDDKAQGPDTPDAPTVTTVSDRILEVTWNAPDPGSAAAGTDEDPPRISGYAVRYQRADADADPDFWTEARETGFRASETLTGLVPNTPYRVQVRAINTYDYKSAWSASGTGTTDMADDTQHAPVIQGTTGTLNVSGNGSPELVHTFEATDADGDWVRFSLKGPDVAEFHIQSRANFSGTFYGDLYIVTPYSCGSDAIRDIVVVATDDTGNTDEVTVKVNICNDPESDAGGAIRAGGCNPSRRSHPSRRCNPQSTEPPSGGDPVSDPSPPQYVQEPGDPSDVCNGETYSHHKTIGISTYLAYHYIDVECIVMDERNPFQTDTFVYYLAKRFTGTVSDTDGAADRIYLTFPASVGDTSAFPNLVHLNSNGLPDLRVLKDGTLYEYHSREESLAMLEALNRDTPFTVEWSEEPNVKAWLTVHYPGVPKMSFEILAMEHDKSQYGVRPGDITNPVTSQTVNIDDGEYLWLLGGGYKASPVEADNIYWQWSDGSRTYFPATIYLGGPGDNTELHDYEVTNVDHWEYVDDKSPQEGKVVLVHGSEAVHLAWSTDTYAFANKILRILPGTGTADWYTEDPPTSSWNPVTRTGGGIERAELPFTVPKTTIVAPNDPPGKAYFKYCMYGEPCNESGPPSDGPTIQERGRALP